MVFRRPTPEQVEASHAREAERRARRGSVYDAAWRALRDQVLAEEDRCYLCGEWINKARRWPDPLSATADHVLPLALGGARLDRENVRAAHFRCNLSKGRKSPAEVYRHAALM